MTTDIDLRETPDGDRRERLWTALDDAAAGDAVTVVAPTDVDPHLVRYQTDRDRRVEWEYDDPDAEPRRLRVSVGDALEGLAVIDVRDLKPQRRHAVLLDAFDELDADEGFLLVNDHDPKPLYHELRSIHGDVVEWTYRSHGSDGWRVAVEKTEESTATGDDVLTRFDVRDIPKQERHPTIHHRYGMIPEGETMELVAPHEPRPLRQEFDAKYGDSFAWTVVETEPGRCRVRITKERAPDSDEGAEAAGDAAGCGCGGHGDDGDGITVVDELDVRDLPPAERHERIFEAYDDLAAGDGFVLVNDHDPKPLYHQFEAEAGPEFRWEYRQRESGEFRVRIGKADAAESAEPIGESVDAPF